MEKAWTALAAAASLSGGIIGGYVLGGLIDRWFGVAPYGAVGGVLVGTAAGLYELWRIVERE